MLTIPDIKDIRSSSCHYQGILNGFVWADASGQRMDTDDLDLLPRRVKISLLVAKPVDVKESWERVGHADFEFDRFESSLNEVGFKLEQIWLH
jgi:hypothetical protein